MKSITFSLGLILVASMTSSGVAATTDAASAPAALPPPPTAAAPPAPPAPAPTPGLKLDDYLNELAASIPLSANQKKNVTALYVEDGEAVKKTLEDATLSPLAKAQQIAGIREARDTRIEALLDDEAQRRTFRELEAKYRVALLQLAETGGWVAAPPAK